jgi:hypothetical protein
MDEVGVDTGLWTGVCGQERHPARHDLLSFLVCVVLPSFCADFWVALIAIGTVLIRETALSSRPFQSGKASAEYAQHYKPNLLLRFFPGSLHSSIPLLCVCVCGVFVFLVCLTTVAREMAMDEVTAAMVSSPLYCTPLLSDMCAYPYDAERDGEIARSADTIDVPVPGGVPPNAAATASQTVKLLRRRSQKKNVSDAVWSVAATQARTNGFLLPLMPGEQKQGAAAAAAKNTMRAVLLPLIGRVNHSCAPNAVMLTPERSTEVVLVSTALIPAGAEVAQSYFEEQVFCLPPAQRQQHLLQSHRFLCACLRCALSNQKHSDKEKEKSKGDKEKPALPAYVLKAVVADTLLQTEVGPAFSAAQRAEMEAEYNKCIALCGGGAGGAREAAVAVGGRMNLKRMTPKQSEAAIMALSEWCVKWCGSAAFVAAAAALASADSKQQPAAAAASVVVEGEQPSAQLHIAHWRCFHIRSLLYNTFASQLLDSGETADARDTESISECVAEHCTAMSVVYPQFELYPRAFYAEAQRLFGAAVTSPLQPAVKQWYEQAISFIYGVESKVKAGAGLPASATAAAAASAPSAAAAAADAKSPAAPKK